MKIADLKVLELSSVLAGPAVGMFFSELGAEVTKVENKKAGGDITRKWKLPEESNPTSSAYYHSVNWAKKVVFLDYKLEEDMKVVLDLIESSDIVITNFKKGDDEKFGLSYEKVKEINPSILYASINGYGRSSNRSAFDVVLQAETGYISMTGSNKGELAKMPVAFIDLLAAHQLKEGLLTAIIENIKPAHISVSLYDTAIASLANQASNYLNVGHIPKPLGTAHPNIAPYGDIFKTADGRKIVLAVGNDKQFNQLIEVLDLEPQKTFESNSKRVNYRSELILFLEPAISSRNSIDLLREFQERGIPCGGVYDLKEVFEQERANSLILKEKVGDEQSFRVKTTIFKISS